MHAYEQLWLQALSAFGKGEPQVDPCLSHRTEDLRRGITVVLRPSLEVQGKVNQFIKHLAAVCPVQQFYHPEELHVTVLSIISGTEAWRQEIRQLKVYRSIISEVLSRQRAFKICFRGVTASPGAVMIQGFPVGDGLAQVRDELRNAFAKNGFTSLLDRRYKISTAHMTVMRFQRPENHCEGLMSLLRENRGMDFGESEASGLQLIWGDWYASRNLVRTLQEYRLEA